MTQTNPIQALVANLKQDFAVTESITPLTRNPPAIMNGFNDNYEPLRAERLEPVAALSGADLVNMGLKPDRRI